MRKRKLHLLIAASILVVFCITTPFFMGCYILDSDYRAMVDEEAEMEKIEREAEEQASRKEVAEDTEAEPTEEVIEEAELAEESSATEEDKSFPNEPVIYTGNLSGIPVTLTVNFKTTEVTGSMPSIAKGFPDTIVTDGTIYLDTLEIYVFFTGVSEMDSDGSVIETSWLTITGKVSDDLSTINGEILNEEGDTGEITLTK